jgi:glutathione S-transferase
MRRQQRGTVKTTRDSSLLPERSGGGLTQGLSNRAANTLFSEKMLMTKMAARVELIVHPLCTFAQRALYTKAYKNLDIEVLEVELVNKVDWFLAVNPQGRIPSARVTKADGRQVNLFESLTIMHYLDSFPGRSLIPEEADGSVSPLTRAACDAQAQYITGKFMGLYNFYEPEPTAEQVQSFKAVMLEVNAIIGSGFTMDSILGTSQITFTDIAILPFIERFVAYKEEALSLVWGGEDFSNIQHRGKSCLQMQLKGRPRRKIQ